MERNIYASKRAAAILQLCRVDKQRASTVYIDKGWVNAKAVCPPYTSWRFKTAVAALLQLSNLSSTPCK